MSQQGPIKNIAFSEEYQNQAPAFKTTDTNQQLSSSQYSLIPGLSHNTEAVLSSMASVWVITEGTGCSRLSVVLPLMPDCGNCFL